MDSASPTQPFVSIIVPTYNRSERLLNAIHSVLVQHYSNFEIIIVDDGSTDDTRMGVDELAKNERRIKYFFKKNQERSIARNYGIAMASGMYVCFLDSDDILYPNHFSTAHELLRRNDFPEVAHLGYQIINENGEVLTVRDKFDNSIRETLIHENILSVNAIFIRRDIANKINFIQSEYAILSEDWYVWLRLAARYQFHFDNTVTSAIVQHQNRSLMTLNPEKLIVCTAILIESLKKDAPFLKMYRKKVGLHFANHYTFLSLILASNKKRSHTMKFLLKAVRYDPMVIIRRRFLATLKNLL